MMKLLYKPKVWWELVKLSFRKDLLFQAEFISKMTKVFVIIGIQLVVAYALFRETDQLSGWSIEQFLLLLGVYNFINYISWGIFNVNLWRLEKKLLKGDFDFYLINPAGSKFMTSFSEFFLEDFISSLTGIVFIGYYFFTTWSSNSLIELLLLVIVLPFSLLVWYSIHLFFASFSLRWEKTQLLDFAKGWSRFSGYPLNVFPETLRWLLVTIIPFAVATSLPVSSIVGNSEVYRIIFLVIFSIILYMVASFYWKYMLKYYTSSGG